MDGRHEAGHDGGRIGPSGRAQLDRAEPEPASTERSRSAGWGMRSRCRLAERSRSTEQGRAGASPGGAVALLGTG